MGRTKEQKLMIAKAFCYDNKLTLEQMDGIWEFMLDKNWKVAKLTDEGLDWTDFKPSRHDFSPGSVPSGFGERKIEWSCSALWLVAMHA